MELNPYVVLGLIVGGFIFVSSLAKGGNFVEALIGGVMVGVIVTGLVKIGKEKLTGP